MIINNNTNYIFKVQYPMYISIRVQWTVHNMAYNFKQYDHNQILNELVILHYCIL